MRQGKYNYLKAGTGTTSAVVVIVEVEATRIKASLAKSLKVGFP